MLFSANSTYGILIAEASLANPHIMNFVDLHCSGFHRLAQYVHLFHLVLEAIFIGTVRMCL